MDPVKGNWGKGLVVLLLFALVQSAWAGGGGTHAPEGSYTITREKNLSPSQQHAFETLKANSRIDTGPSAFYATHLGTVVDNGGGLTPYSGQHFLLDIRSNPTTGKRDVIADISPFATSHTFHMETTGDRKKDTKGTDFMAHTDHYKTNTNPSIVGGSNFEHGGDAQMASVTRTTATTTVVNAHGATRTTYTYHEEPTVQVTGFYVPKDINSMTSSAPQHGSARYQDTSKYLVRGGFSMGKELLKEHHATTPTPPPSSYPKYQPTPMPH
jgi:hypothetical protein